MGQMPEDGANESTQTGQAPLQIAAGQGRVAAVARLLLEKGEDMVDVGAGSVMDNSWG